MSDGQRNCVRRRSSQVNPIMAGGNVAKGCHVPRAEVFNKNNYWNRQSSSSCPDSGYLFCSNLRACGILLL